MTRIETARVKEVIGLHIGAIREAAGRLSAESELEELESGISELERKVADLKECLHGLPIKHSEFV